MNFTVEPEIPIDEDVKTYLDHVLTVEKLASEKVTFDNLKD
jgi:hypothetical protein